MPRLQATPAPKQPTPGDKPYLIPLVEAATHGLMVTRYQESRFHFVWHYHLEHELVWVRKGSGTRYVGSSVRHFRSGDLFLLGPNLPHTLASGTQTRHGADWTVVQFRPALWGGGFWNLPETRDLTNLLNQARDGLQFNGSQLPAIGKKMEDLAARPQHTIESLIDFLIILRDLLQAPCESLNATSSGLSGPQPDPRLKCLLEWLQRQVPDDKIPQAVAARQVGMSPEVFSRWFKSRTGRTFRTHRNEIRIARVCSMLAGRGARIGDAAYACGFDNLANFNRRFLELVGITPTEFRRQSKADQERSTMDIIMRMGANDYLHLAAGVLAPPTG